MFVEYIQLHWLASLLILVGAGAAIYLTAVHHAQIRTFVSEVKVELKKASWPWDPKEKGVKKYKELIDSTLMVVIAMLLMGGYVAFWDFLLVNIVGAITKP